MHEQISVNENKVISISGQNKKHKEIEKWGKKRNTIGKICDLENWQCRSWEEVMW